MAYDLSSLQGYSYFRKFGSGAVDQYFIESVILPGLSKQGKFAVRSRGIELPHGDDEPAQFLPLREAALLTIDWLESRNAITSSEKSNLENLLGKSSYSQIALTLELTLSKRIKDPQKILSTRLTENLAAMQADLERQETAQGGHAYNPTQAILEWNRLRMRVTQMAGRGIPRNIILRLIPDEFVKTSSELERSRLVNFVVNHLPELASSAHVTENGEGKNYPELVSARVSQTAAELIRSTNPELSGFLNFLGENQTQTELYQLIKSLESTCQVSGISLNSLESAKLRAANALPLILAPTSKLDGLIRQQLSFLDPKDQQQIASAIVKVVRSSSHKALTTEQILTIVGKDLGIDASTLSSVKTALYHTPLSAAIEYQQNELHFTVTSQHLTSSERALLKAGINPFHAHYSDQNLLEEASQILGVSIRGLTLEAASSQIASLHENEAHNPSFSLPRYNRYRSWLERRYTLGELALPSNSRLRSLVSRSQAERWLYNANSKIRNAETTFWNKWFKIEENLPWNKGIRKLLEGYDHIAEGGVIKVLGRNLRPGVLTIPLPKGKKLEIPYLRFMPWLFSSIDTFKRKTALGLYRTLSKSRWRVVEPIRKLLRFSIREYSFGGYTVNGALFHFSGAVWGKSLKWAITKTGLSSVFKYSAKLGGRKVVNAGMRTVIRFLIKIGGKGLGKIGTKIAGVLVGSVIPIIGTIFAALSVIGIAADLISLGYNFIKEFVHNADFRKMVTKIGALFAAPFAFFASLNLGASLAALLGFLSASMLAAVTSTVLIAIGLVAIFGVLHHTMQTTTMLAPEYEGPASAACFQNVICSKEKAPAGVPAAPNSPISQKAFELVTDLYQGFWCYWNRPANPEKTEAYISYFGAVDTVTYADTNQVNKDIFDYELFLSTPNPTREQIQTSGNALYWCTYLVQHAFRETGNDSLANTLWSPTMQDDFIKRKKYIDWSTANEGNTEPGAVIFFKVAGGPDRTNHVGVVNSVYPGGLSFYQSNAGTKNGSVKFGSNLSGITVLGIGNP